MPFAVLASGNGSNLQAIIQACQRGDIRAKLALVVSDKADAYALERARKAGIPTAVILPKAFKSREAFDRAVVALLRKKKIDLVVLAGFMRILSPYFVKAFRHKILNIHPALLPAFKGAHAIADAFKAKVTMTGVTVHIVDEEVDHGPIVGQVAVPVLKGDSLPVLETRIHQAEHALYPKAINAFLMTV